MNITNFTDKKLLIETIKAVKIEKEHTYKVLCHLKEIYRRRLYLDLNLNSLHEYCCKELGYTSGESQYRVAAVKLMLNSPRIEKAIETKELPLSNAVLVHNHLSKSMGKTSVQEKENIVEKIIGKSKMEAKEILAGNSFNQKSSMRTKKDATQKITIDVETQELLQELLALSGQSEQKSIKDALIQRIKTLKELRQKQAAKSFTEHRQKTKESFAKQTRYIPQSEKAKVLLRAKGRCEFLASDGSRCKNHKNLEFDHYHTPYGVGAENSAENLKYHCRGHNQRGAVKFYGASKMQKYQN